MTKEHLHQPKHEAVKHHDSAEQQAHSERVKAHHEREAAKETKTVNLAELEQQANEEAKSAAESVSHKVEKPREDGSEYVSGELKRQKLDHTFTQVRKHLSAPNRAFSKVIHQPAIESISNATGKTIARPSGVLGGAIMAFIGSSAFLWAAKHYGFSYNYLLFVIFFVGGFVVGMALELLLFAFRRKKA